MVGDNQKKVKVTDNGPYKVTGKVAMNKLRYKTNERGFSLSYEETESYPVKDTSYLCRCGKSLNKPYCDGTHMEGFDGTETAGHRTYDEMAKCIEGKLMDLLDAEELCSVSRFCDTKSGTWNLVETAENLDAKDIVKHQCIHCPSGRLTMVTKEGERIEPYLPKQISVLQDPDCSREGPLWIQGGMEIEDAQGKCYPIRNRVTLCCCGRSKNKPFCDASHVDD